MPDQDNEDLIRRYFEICNTALRLNKDRFPFKQIIGAAAVKNKNDQIEIKISDSAPQDRFVVYLDKDKIISKRHDECENCNCVRQWTTNRKYLRSVIINPEIYIGNPARLDWSWMYDCANR